MERVEAALHGWPQAPYYSKADVDANYKRMVLWGCQPERVQAVNLGIASHNLFDIAFAMQVRAAWAIEPYVEFEMLEGMANHQARAVQAEAGGLLLYAPVVKQDDFHSAIAYLVRRLDENTAEENFLHDLFSLKVGNETWQRQKQFFLTSVQRYNAVAVGPNRTQNRTTEQRQFSPEAPFENEPDTDFSLPANQAWAKSIVEAWQQAPIADIPLQIDGQYLTPNLAGIGRDPSRPKIEVAYRYALAEPDQIELALATAVAAQNAWRNTSIQARKTLLVQVAERLAAKRANLIGAAILDGGKTIPQADTEVSEAIDFANYYARSLDFAETELANCHVTPLGTVLITPPWNFPIAIPAGGMLAALMAGNSVILKPAPETVFVAWEVVNAFWEAGIPQNVLQFVPTTDDEVGQSLVIDDRVNAVILTGGYDTARLFLSWKPTLRLLAETSGKNSMIISALADHDQAIKDLVYSAFGHSGQKCSAASLAILEAEVYDNPKFRRQLADAVSSLTVGSAWHLASIITPLIRPPVGALAKAQTTLDDDETWLLKPEIVNDNPNLWSPGIKFAVKPGSFYHTTECFGPVLGVMRAKNLSEAIDMVNDSDFGLTSGLHSLDDREITRWKAQIEAGNLYVNRGTTGAIVQRQPFGGWKKSAFGSGAKAGGPNYVLSLGTWRDLAPEADWQQQLAKAKASYQAAWETHFSRQHDPSQLLGERNIFRYRPIKRMVVRINSDTPLVNLFQVTAAADICGVPLTVSLPVDMPIPEALAGVIIMPESGRALAEKIGNYERIRLLSPPSTLLLIAAHKAHVPIHAEPVTANGRLELRHYLREQSVTETRHRYGNLIFSA